jgi:hypothetical protein
MVAAVKTTAESLELSIVGPFYNEAENIEVLHARLSRSRTLR